MGKYLILWSIKNEVIPSDPDEYNQMIDMLSMMVKQGHEMGLTDWGLFASNVDGYYIFEGDFSDLIIAHKLTMPYLDIMDVQQVLTKEEADKAQKEAMSMMKAMQNL